MTIQQRPVVLRPSEIPARQRGGGAKTIPLVTRKAGSTSFINGITVFDPGAAIPLHKHNCEESVMLLEGDAVAEIDGVEYPIRPGDVTFIPANVPHRFRNVSDSRVMKILWIYASLNATRTLIETGETRTIDDEHAARMAS
ncbi:cupin domain-containing protein [Inquilinus sp. NPDC058860]|uniref:cupin domain-containing protein n=1 Tax=Inquilinus sp. NPDC058860 TaxID=3346652 RepID=UPI00368F306B